MTLKRFQMTKIDNKIRQIVSLLTCCLMLVAVAINKNQAIFGYELKSRIHSKEVIQVMDDGSTMISTKEIGKDIVGFGGDTPLEIYLKDGVITNIKPLKNSESQEFFRKVIESGIFSKWIGLTPEEALQTKVDAVSGATLSSKAIISTMKRSLQYATRTSLPEKGDYKDFFSLKSILVIIVVLSGTFLPLIIRFKHYRTIQLILNVLVLGFWSGSFISYSLLVNFFSNGINLWGSLITVLLLLVGFILPLFGKKSHYCTWVCPMGGFQELAGKTVKYKISITPKHLKCLNYFREGLWCALMLLMWSGLFFNWMDYELFTAFLFRQAYPIVIVITILFLLLSIFINRPYCRFVCPTGNLLRLSQNSK